MIATFKTTACNEGTISLVRYAKEDDLIRLKKRVIALENTIKEERLHKFYEKIMKL